jgi:hypothetical protein
VPFRVRSGTVSKLIVVWCPEKVVKILIQRVSIVLETRDANFAQSASASAEAKQRAENAAKQLLLEEWEARLNENLSPHDVEATHGHDTQEEPGGRSLAPLAPCTWHKILQAPRVPDARGRLACRRRGHRPEPHSGLFCPRVGVRVRVCASILLMRGLRSYSCLPRIPRQT